MMWDMSFMPSARTARRRHSVIVAAILGCAAFALLVGATEGRADAGKRYFFNVTEIKVADGVKAEVIDHVKAAVAEAIAASDDIVGSLEGAPDPEANPKAYKAFLKKKKLAAFRVNVEVMAYETKLEALEAPRRGNRFTVSISVRMFGETIPDRVMAFSGDGAATIKLEIGKKLRPKDSEEAHKEAALGAIGNALASSREKLATPPPKAKKTNAKK